MFDWTIPAGFATGRHVHRVQEETFYVLEGECEWHVGDKTIRATPGTYLFIPPGVPHNITNVSEKPAAVLMTVSPPGTSIISKSSPNSRRRVRRIQKHSPICETATTPTSSRR